MDDSQPKTRSLAEIMTTSEEVAFNSKFDLAVKALRRYMSANENLYKARYLWYLAEYEQRASETSSAEITVEQLEAVVHTYGKALTERIAAWHELADKIGL